MQQRGGNIYYYILMIMVWIIWLNIVTTTLKIRNHYEKGWNVFKKFINKLLKKISMLKFQFIKIKFPKNLKVKQNLKDISRTWTLDIGNQKYFINGLGILNKFYLLKIKKK